jgi:hypothetical protein
MRGAGVQVEADLWFGRLVTPFGGGEVMLRPAIARELRSELARNAADLRLAKELVDRFQSTRPLLVRLEEELVWRSLKAGPAEKRSVRNLLRRITKTILDNDDRVGLARWAFGLRCRIPEIAENRSALHLERAATFCLGLDEATTDAGAMRTLADREKAFYRSLLRDTIDIGLWSDGTSMSLRKPPKEGDEVLTITAEGTHTLYVQGSGNDELESILSFRNPKPRADVQQIFLSCPAKLPAVLRTATGETFVIHSRSEIIGQPPDVRRS